MEGGDWCFSNSVYEAAEEADAIVILTEWDEFRKLDWRKIAKVMRSPAWVFDTRGITNIKDAKFNLINTWSIGDGSN